MDRMRTGRLLLVAAIVLTGAACGDQTELGGSATDLEPVQLPVWGDAEEIGPDGMTQGVLQGDPDEGCVWLVEGLEEGEDHDPAMTLMWREGYAFDTSTMEVLDPEGEAVANVGDTVALGGGEVPHFEPDRCEVGDSVWAVSSIEVP